MKMHSVRMRRPRRRRWPRISVFPLLLLGAAIACNAPFRDVEPSPTDLATIEREPGEVTREGEIPGAIPESTAASPATVPAILRTPEATVTGVNTAQTPGLEIPTLAATMTPSRTSTRSPTSTATGEGTGEPPATTTGTLSFSYVIDWRLNPSNPMESIATVTIYASGGGGGYEYYSDDLPVDGPVFEFTWVSCKARPGSLRVDSADGQSVRENYYETPPCPTPTPTP